MDELEDDSVSNVVIRNSPVSATTFKHLERIMGPYSVLTISGSYDDTSEIWTDVNREKRYKGWTTIKRFKPLALPVGRGQSNGGKIAGYGVGGGFSVQFGPNGPTYVGPDDIDGVINEEPKK